MSPRYIAAGIAFAAIAAGGAIYAVKEGGQTVAPTPPVAPPAGTAPEPAGTAQPAAQSAGATTVTVTVTAAGCEPNDLSVAAGPNTFSIVNKSSRALEWEILKGVMVVDERENIAPGFTQKLTTKLDPGDYDVTCGLLSNPKGRLHVTGEVAQATKPDLMDLIGPIAEYKVYVGGEVAALRQATGKFADAVKAGDLKSAQALYAPARIHYERIEPIAELFSDLDTAIDSRADDHEQKEADPGFKGFHRIEYGLFAKSSTDELAPLADTLVNDLADLDARVAKLTIPPSKMVGGAADLIEEVASSKITGEEDRYSHTDLWDFQANIDGAKKIVDLLHPLIEKADAALLAKVDTNFATIDAILAKYHTPDGGFEGYDKLTKEDRVALQGPVTILAEALSRLRGTLGLS